MEDYIGAPGGEIFTNSLEREFKETMMNEIEQYYISANMSSTANNYTTDEFGRIKIKDAPTHGVKYNLFLDNCKTIKYKSMPPDFQTTVDKNFEGLLDDSNGKKESKDKLSYELDFDFIKQMAERMVANKGTYPPYNWKKPIDIEGLKQANFRHILEIMEGRYEDDGREFGHLEAIALNSMFINYQLKHNV